MNRYRNWVGGLHLGQITLLIPALVLAGGAFSTGADTLTDTLKFVPPDLSYESFLADRRFFWIRHWIRLSGNLGCYAIWATAFLSLWWWFGARAKPRETL
jgi:hypothetical protein